MRDVEGTSAPAAFLLTAVRRHVTLVVAVTVLFLLAGVGVALRHGIVYSSSAAILVNPLEGNPYAPEGRSDELINLETEARLVGTDVVARLASKTFKSGVTVDEMRDLVDVGVPTNTQVLEIRYSANARELAREGAQAFADAYLDYRSSRAKTIVDVRLQRLRQQQASTRSQLSEVTAELAEVSATSSRRTYLEERVSALAARLATLETEQTTLSGTDVNPGQVITPAALPARASSTDLAVFGLGGALAGLLLAATLALLQARTDDRIHDPHELDELGIEALSVVPARQRIGVVPPSGDLPEAYRVIRTGIITSLDAPPVTVALASASPGVSAAPEAAGLAVGLARAGYNVSVIDIVGDTTRLLVGRVQEPGLSELLAENADLRSTLLQPEDGLTLVTAGRRHPQTMDRLLSPQMRLIVKQLRDWHDYVLIAGRYAHSADGQALAALSDAAVVVAARHVTTRTRLEDTVEVLGRVEMTPSAVLVEVPKRSSHRFRRLLGWVLSPLVRRGSGGRRARASVSDTAENIMPRAQRW